MAASLGLTTEDPTLEASSVYVDFNEFPGGFGDLVFFGAAIDYSSEASLSNLATIDFLGSFSLTDPTDLPFGYVDFFDGSLNNQLTGDLVDVGYTTDTIELLFSSLAGPAAGEFGTQILMSIFFDDQLGDNPFSALVDGESYMASISVSNVASTAVVPVPMGLPLLLSAFIGLGWASRRGDA